MGTVGAAALRAGRPGDARMPLAIRGPGEDGQTPVIQSGGRSQELAATLTAETYELWCPVGNH
jgi:hypothetical protein